MGIFDFWNKKPKHVCAWCEEEFESETSLFKGAKGNYCLPCYKLLLPVFIKLEGDIQRKNNIFKNNVFEEYTKPCEIKLNEINYFEKSKFGVSILVSMNYKLSDLITGLKYKKTFENSVETKGVYVFNNDVIGDTVFNKKSVFQHQIFFDIEKLRKYNLIETLDKYFFSKDKMTIEAIIDKYQTAHYDFPWLTSSHILCITYTKEITTK